MSDEIHYASTNDPVGGEEAQRGLDMLIEAPDAVSLKPITTDSLPATVLHYEIETKCGRLVCDYYPLLAASDGSEGAATHSVISDFKSRFGADLLTVEKAVSEINDHQERLLVEMDTTEQLYVNQLASAAWLEFTHGLGRWLGNAVIQFFELCILAARIQNSALTHGSVATLKNRPDTVSSLVKRQADEWLTSPHLSWKPLMYLPFHYYVDCLPFWKDAKTIYIQNKTSGSVA